MSEYLDLLRKVADDAENELQGAVVDACPGQHKATQHRDGKPPWCPACGRTNRGVQIKEVSQS